MTLSPSKQRREAGTSPSASRRTRRRLSVTHVVIAVAVILAFVLNLLVLQDRSSTTLVAVADRPLATGAQFGPSSVRLVPLASDFEGIENLVSEDDLSSLQGYVLTRPVPEGGLLDRTALVQAGSQSGLRSMSLPVPIEHAAGGSLGVGDRVDVVAVVDGVARFVAVDLEVTAVSGSTGAPIGSVSVYHVVVNVDADDALALAEALDSGPVEVLRSTGAERIEDGP